MISMSEYQKEDLSLIKGHLLTLVICIALIGGIFWTANTLKKSAALELQQTRSQLDNIRSSMDTLKSEEGTASKYLDKFQSLQMSGVIGAEDRLQLLESLAQIRAQHELLPISINIGEQAEYTLPYTNTLGDTGKPIKLRSSVLSMDIPLLHEGDLARLMNDLLASSPLLQPASCRIATNNAANTNFYYLNRHFNAACSMYWYTFDITGVDEAQP
ncbi:MAG: hypothetical protein V4628_11760 [Pseudomonadota bacterium]